MADRFPSCMMPNTFIHPIPQTLNQRIKHSTIIHRHSTQQDEELQQQCSHWELKPPTQHKMCVWNHQHIQNQSVVVGLHWFLCWHLLNVLPSTGSQWRTRKCTVISLYHSRLELFLLTCVSANKSIHTVNNFHQDGLRNWLSFQRSKRASRRESASYAPLAHWSSELQLCIQGHRLGMKVCLRTNKV